MKKKMKVLGLLSMLLLAAFCTTQDKSIKVQLEVSEESLYNMDFQTIMSYETITQESEVLQIELVVEEMKMYDIDLELLMQKSTKITSI